MSSYTVVPSRNVDTNKGMDWVNILHAYQPPDWDPHIVDRVARECYDPLAAFLEAAPDIKITLNITGSLCEQLAARGRRPLLRRLGDLTRRGQIELTTTPKYHALLPFVTPDELERQVIENTATLRTYLGITDSPAGFFPPELAVDESSGRLIDRLGQRWVILDELAATEGFGTIDTQPTARWSGTDVRILFRHRGLSDYLAFQAIEEAPRFTDLVRSLGFGGDTLITAMDAENLGHHRPAAAGAWQRLVTRPDVKTITASELLRFPTKIVDLLPRPTSWSTDDHDLARRVPFPLWDHPENPVHRALHRLARAARALLVAHRDRPGYTEARRRLDRAQASDVYWWASMRPMWDATIVLREAREFVTALEPLRLDPHPLSDLWTDLSKTVADWEQSGRAAAARSTYLHDHRSTRFFAGHHLT